MGKSSLIAIFLGKQRDLARVSTAVAEESVHLCPVRDVSTSTYTDQWELVDIDRQARMVAHTSRHLLTSEGVRRVDEYEDNPKQSATNEELVQEKEAFLASHRTSSPPPPPPPPKKGELAKKAYKFFCGLSKFIRRSQQLPEASVDADLVASPSPEPSLVTSLGDDPDNIEGLYANFRESLQEIMRDCGELRDLILYYSIRLLDSGGQPQFHEIASIVVPAVTGIVSVFKLSESLGVHGEVVFYKDGVQGNDPYKSYLTNEQVIRHDLLAIQSVASHSGTEEIPCLAFVGTFLDKKDDCPEETPDQKDERLHSMITEILSPEMQKCVVSKSGSLEQVTFRLNAREPTDTDYQSAGKLKEALTTQSRVKPKNLPLKWCGYEVALRKLMDQLKRQTLTIQECEFIGHKLGFDPPSLKACLNYLRQLHIITFYDVLPSLVFGSCQVILDKITELVTLSLELKKGDRISTGAERRFHQQGILSLDILRSKACSKHYSNKHFTPEDLLNVLKSLFIVTEVGPGEYLMPCVLEVSDIFPSPQSAVSKVQSFVLHFSKKSPMLGIYCCTISYLLTVAGWKLFSKGGEVVQVARNSIAFQLPQELPGKLTFLDPLSSYLQVVVEMPAIIAEEHSTALYREIRDVFLAGLKQAMQTLNYELRTPELSFLCPEQSTLCSTSSHLAVVNLTHSLLTCSISPDSVAIPLTPDHKMWLASSSASDVTCSISPDSVAIPLNPDHKMWQASSSASGEFICHVKLLSVFFIVHFILCAASGKGKKGKKSKKKAVTKPSLKSRCL